MKNKLVVMLMGALLMMSGCTSDDKQDASETKADKTSFMSIGGFSVNPIDKGWVEVRDGAGREFVLIPRGETPPAGYEPRQIIYTPVQRVVAYGSFDIAILKALGVIEDVLVGVTAPKKEWAIPEVVTGMEKGKIAFLGNYNAIDFERLKQSEPELVMTWDMSIIPMVEEMGAACVITTTPVAMCLNARMHFVKFIAPFFNREKQAQQYFHKVATALENIRETTRNATDQPKVMWGDIYEKRVLVEPGNAWVGELVGLAQSDYLFDDVFGKSCIEISLERFLFSGQDAQIFFTYRTPKNGATSKAALARANPMIAGLKPLKDGKVYSPLPHYSQSGDRLDEILTDIAAIIHPSCYPGYKSKFFRELPDKDPES
ncbi:iron complex transport system substrate-binding protein [Desulfocicer vacuolatum DSM 3385]|uniref:Iron complex transport system substrate-binding protein n=1 Tax=Desulfocicer vacuolatum DSM 3385 TaxID=1121400 RepID=A0A1W1YS27_9BACT|nr:ABC transporter substrate-binding protein [Desulfocicer vacuolatum]SMC38912.1 iron complex transport system substrate-binding protein [Desulfocicer vacuolatum DSM 3385]